jgi:methylmalonyl-CoA mutase N-terminal domain/subunit
MIEAIKRGFPQREIADAAFRYQREVDAGERVVVGVNDYRVEGEEEIPILRIDPELERKQADRLTATRARRDPVAVERALAALKEAAATDGNLMEPIIAATRVRASEGEMVAAMQEVFGTYTEQPQF